jgi:hypothetical protein
MKNSISEALQSVHTFFGGSYSSYESIYPIRNYLKLPVLDMGLLGVSEINAKHKGMFSYLGVANREETKIVLFVCNNNIDYGEPRFQIFCHKDGFTFQHVINDKKVFSDNDLDGFGGWNILTTVKDFCEGEIAKELIPSTDELALDIINYLKTTA